MLLGAIVDLGVPLESIQAGLSKLDVAGYRLSSSSGSRHGVNGTAVSVEEVGDGREPYRWQDFIRIVRNSSLPSTVVERSCSVFQRLAQAEASVHGTSIEETTLHELGEVDTLVDVVGTLIGFDSLEVDELYSSPVPSGSGVRKSAHGWLPMPAPATAALFALAKAPLVPPPGRIPDAGEMVTPTGAAILTTLARFCQPVMNLEGVGYGLGSRNSEHYPNVVALWLGREIDISYNSCRTMLETNIDDMSPELLGYVQERLLELGARDVWFTSIQMKKNRPGTMISAIVSSELEGAAIDLILRETSTLGVRSRSMTRYEAEREIVETDTSLGRIEVKVKWLEGRVAGVSPEYEACRRIAKDKGIPLQDVYRRAQREAEDRLMKR